MLTPSPDTGPFADSQRTPLLAKLRELPAKIQEHPWPAIGIAFGLGMFMAWTQKPRDGFGGVIATGLGALAARLIKDAMFGEMLGATAQWLAPAGTASRASRMRDVEPFLEH